MHNVCICFWTCYDITFRKKASHSSFLAFEMTMLNRTTENCRQVVHSIGPHPLSTSSPISKDVQSKSSHEMPYYKGVLLLGVISEKKYQFSSGIPQIAISRWWHYTAVRREVENLWRRLRFKSLATTTVIKSSMSYSFMRNVNQKMS